MNPGRSSLHPDKNKPSSDVSATSAHVRISDGQFVKLERWNPARMINACWLGWQGGHGAYEDCMPVAGKKKLKKTTIRTV